MQWVWKYNSDQGPDTNNYHNAMAKCLVRLVAQRIASWPAAR